MEGFLIFLSVFVTLASSVCTASLVPFRLYRLRVEKRFFKSVKIGRLEIIVPMFVLSVIGCLLTLFIWAIVPTLYYAVGLDTDVLFTVPLAVAVVYVVAFVLTEFLCVRYSGNKQYQEEHPEEFVKVEPVVEQSVKDEPIVEEPVEEVHTVEEAPVVEEAPIEAEPIVEQPAVEEPIVEEQPIAVAEPIEEVPVVEEQPIEEAPVEEQPEAVQEEQTESQAEEQAGEQTEETPEQSEEQTPEQTEEAETKKADEE